MNEDVPRRELTSRIGRLGGAKVVSCRRVEGGCTPALRLPCETDASGFFAKIGTTPATCESLSREIRTHNSLRGDFMPRLVAWEGGESAPILVIEDLSAQHWPPPWDARRIDLTLAQIDALHHTPASVETFVQVHGMSEGELAGRRRRP